MANKQRMLKPLTCAACRYGSLPDRRICTTETHAGSRAWIIAENPGQNEAEHGKPLHPDGATGEQVRWAIRDAGLEAAVDLGNVACCILPKPSKKTKSGGESEAAFVESRAYCLATHTLPAMEAAQPERLVLLGAKSLRAFMGLGEYTPYKIMDLHGSVWSRPLFESVRSEFAERVLAPIPVSVRTITVGLHPSFGVQGRPALKPLIRGVIQRGLRAEPASGPESVEVAVGDAEMAAFLGANAVLGLDVETDAERNVTIVGLSNGRQTKVTSATRALLTALVRWLNEPKHSVVGHNLNFDLDCAMVLGAKPRAQIIDTMDMASIVHPGLDGMPWHSLQTCALRYIEGICAWKPRRYRKTGEHLIDWRYAHAIYRAMRPDLPTWLYEQFYCGLDVLWSWRMWMGGEA